MPIQSRRRASKPEFDYLNLNCPLNPIYSSLFTHLGSPRLASRQSSHHKSTSGKHCSQMLQAVVNKRPDSTESMKNPVDNHPPIARTTRSNMSSQSCSGSKKKPRQHSGKVMQDNLCLHKLIGEIKQYLQHRTVRWSIERLKYRQWLQLAKVLGYTRYEHEEEFIRAGCQEELKKCYWVWVNIANAESRSMKLVDLLAVVCVVEGIEVKDKVLNDVVEEVKDGCSEGLLEEFEEEPMYIFYTKKVLSRVEGKGFTIEEQKQIRKKLESFKLTKFNDERKKEEKLVKEVLEGQMSIQLSKRSEELAQQKRKKIVDAIKEQQPNLEEIGLIDLLSYKSPIKESSCDYNDELPTSAIDFTEAKVAKDSTIKLTKAKRLEQVSSPLLQSLAEPRPPSKDRSLDEALYESSKHECSFHPVIHPFSKAKRPKRTIPLQDKATSRMQKGRSNKEEKENMLQKGWTLNNKNRDALMRIVNSQGKKDKSVKVHKNNHSRSKQEERHKGQSIVRTELISQINEDDSLEEIPRCLEDIKLHAELSTMHSDLVLPTADTHCDKFSKREYLSIPILYIDVNLEEGRKERIVIYEGDRAEELAEEFGKKHHLGEDTVAKLKTVLEVQISSILEKIDEENEEDCSFVH